MPRTCCTIASPAACWAARSAARPLASSEGMVGAENGIAVTWINGDATAWRSSVSSESAWAAPPSPRGTRLPSARS